MDAIIFLVGIIGGATSIETFIKLVKAPVADQFLTVNIHEVGVLKKFNVPAENRQP
jgi:hypothetical protein